MLFAGGNKAVEGEGVLANMRVNEKGDFGVEFAERGVRRKRNLNEIAYATDIDEHLIRAFFGEASPELANHGRPVLPPFLRLSTQEVALERDSSTFRCPDLERSSSLQMRIARASASCHF